VQKLLMPVDEDRNGVHLPIGIRSNNHRTVEDYAVEMTGVRLPLGRSVATGRSTAMRAPRLPASPPEDGFAIRSKSP
jgi:hypothetical protein